MLILGGKNFSWYVGLVEGRAGAGLEAEFWTFLTRLALCLSTALGEPAQTMQSSAQLRPGEDNNQNT